MKTTDFSHLTIEEKAAHLCDRGVCLMSLRGFHKALHLFSVDGSYAEVEVNEESKRIERIELLSAAGLDKYLVNIRLFSG